MSGSAFRQAVTRRLSLSCLAAFCLVTSCRSDQATGPRPLVKETAAADKNISKTCYYDLSFGWNCKVENFYTIIVWVGGYSFTDNHAMYADCTLCAASGEDDGPVVGNTGVPLAYYDMEDKALADSLHYHLVPQEGCYEVPGLKLPDPTESNFDKAKFVSYMNAHAGPGPNSGCARAVRLGLCDAGVQGACDAYRHPYCAKFYGGFLYNNGFTETWSGSGRSTGPTGSYPAGYTPQAGDIVVFFYKGAGHVAGYNGTNWVSDYQQEDIQPSPNTFPDRSYTIYRRP